MAAGTTKTTFNLNRYYKEQLEYFVRIKELDSVTQGINLAIEYFVKAKRKELYDLELKKVANDADFIERTTKTQKEFEKIDADMER